MEIFLTVFLMYGITFGIKDAKLIHAPRLWVARKSRFLSALLGCAYCTGFHSGWISFLVLHTGGLAKALPFWWGLPIYALVGAAVSYVLDTAMVYLEGN